MAEFLSANGLETRFFHAAMTPDRKMEVQNAFISGNLRVISATNAFGMGIDKDNVRAVVHNSIPGSLENYLQEAGRAGRDGKPAHCILMFHDEGRRDPAHTAVPEQTASGGHTVGPGQPETDAGEERQAHRP